MENVDAMRLDKIYYIIFSTLILINFIISPSIQELSNHIRHDVFTKAGARVLGKNLKKDFSFTPLIQSNNNLTDRFFYQFRTAQNFPIFKSSNPTSTLSILSTIRLTL